MSTQEHLRRELGFWAALTIGAGTMIGAGIFLLSGIAISLAGPGAIFSYIAAGVVCIITAASAAELATGMPTSGGDYFFVSRSLGPSFGAISGIGIWLSLTFAIAFYLVGMGEYLHEFLPISPIWGAVAGGVLLMALNVVGAKESGGAQVVVVLTLMGILGIYTVSSGFNMDSANLVPFLPQGVSPVFSTTALVFISFLGFVKIAAVSEEIKEPSKNLPRALIGSVALVTVLYVLIVLVTAGMLTQAEIAQTRTPLTLIAERMFGPVGAGILIFAGLLATTSSANASIMAASRINLAMARDRMIPQWLNKIHPKRLTPYRAILLTSLLALLLLSIDSLETLAEIASVLQLYSYAALNIGTVILRVANPDWYKPTFRVPATPYVQVLAAIGCLGIILLSGVLAQAVILGLIGLSLTWYFVWGRSRVDIEYGLVQFRQQWSQIGWRVLFKPPVIYTPMTVSAVTPTVRAIEMNAPRRVMTALANPHHEADLLRLGRYLATGREEGGKVLGIHLVRVPLQTPLVVARRRFAERPSLEQTISSLAVKAVKAGQTENGQTLNGLRPIAQTKIEPVIDVAHDVFNSLLTETGRHQADLLLMGWQGGFNVSRIYNSPVQRIIVNTPVDVAILKNRGILETINSILIPWGGGPHAQLGLEFAVRISEAAGATINLLRIVRPEADLEKELEAVRSAAKARLANYDQVQYHVQPGENIAEAMMAFIDAEEHDLIIIGASHEWRIRNVLFGSIPDIVADHAKCSVLMVRRHLLEH
ncbi:amino acid permease [Candidatus Leptofilum sp.]|uniref:amino acid permease n=1 Tax=Candidatus Leptofilum sp. TaxID=3241576 RepID=UPI003B5C1462